ncbi:OB-fold domain-containing protein [Candidatus Gottesmanbacteria bacterium]|nr:OB-fold domain-containing protein [Candidatus Gottesmanbacteria bacterium]
MSISPVKIWRNQKKIANILNKTGKIISYSQVYVPPSGFENEAPYPIVLVEFIDKKRFLAQLTDWKSINLKIGQKVQAVLRKTRSAGTEGVIPYGIKFKPII